MRKLSDNIKEVEELKAEPWMLKLLELNPDYVDWGPYEAYMWKLNDKEAKEDGKKNGCGWESHIILAGWQSFKSSWTLNLNECINFYFSVIRESEDDIAHVSLTLWIIHPRFGASRGLEISFIQENELTDIFAYLREAAHRNAKRFMKIPKN